mgnify:CR=1 FL=1
MGVVIQATCSVGVVIRRHRVEADAHAALAHAQVDRVKAPGVEREVKPKWLQITV